jgi:hypothetical protein
MEESVKRLLRIIILVPLLLVSSCQKEGSPTGPVTPPAGPKIATGTFVDVGTQSLTSAGGTIAVNRPGEPIDGFRLTAPQGAFSQSQSFSISYADVKSHQFGKSFNPVSPLIRISSDAGYAAHEMVVKIPIKLPAGSFAMGFFYDAAAGTLEPLSAASLDSTSITITTRHLSTANARTSKRLFKGAQTVGEIVISAILNSVLLANGTITSGFTPGVDDWEFPNFGSYIAPNGHCAGQSVTAIWYYLEKKLKGDPPLFGRFDRVHNALDPAVLWQDNPLGYRLATAIQYDLDFTHWDYYLWADSWTASLVWSEFLYSMLLTGQPQLVIIRDSKSGGGHALVVYKIDPSARLLYVADPNFPNNSEPGTGKPTLRTMEYVPGAVMASFKPYAAAASAADPNKTLYDQIGYAAITSHIDWAQIGRRWAEFQAGTVGNDIFPQYTLYQFETGTPLQFHDSLVTTLSAVTLDCESDECTSRIPLTANRQVIEAFDPSIGALIAKGDSSSTGLLRLPLQVGNNEFGLCMYGANTTSRENYVDFKWVHIFRRINLTVATTEADQAPIATAGITGRNYTFIAKSGGRAPRSSGLRYVWDFGDGTLPVTVLNDSTVVQRFSKEGTFTVKVTLNDGQSPAGQGQAQVTIGSALALIKQARIDLMLVDYYRSCTDSGRMHTDSWTYESTNGAFSGWTYNATWMDTVFGGYPQVPIPYSTTMKISLTLNSVGALCVVDSFRVLRVYNEPWGCTITEVVTGQHIPWDSGHPENGYMNYVLSGTQLPTSVALSWVEHCISGGCEDKIIQYSLTNSRLDIHFY